MDSKVIPNAIGTIICDAVNEEVEFKPISENKRSGFIIAEGIIQTGNELNRNRRYYPTNELRIGINSPRTQELVKSGNFKGEAGHPLDKSLDRQAKVDPTLEQVWYTKLWMSGDNVMAHFRGTNNALGQSFNADLRDGQRPSFSLRALGSIENRNGKAYVNNLRIITWDRVYYPSHPTAYMEKIISEGTELMDKPYKLKANMDMIKEYGNTQAVEEGYQIIAPFSNKSVVDFIKQESCNLQTIVENFDVFYQSISLSESGKMVTLVDKNYDTIFVPLEKYIQNEIMNYCMK